MHCRTSAISSPFSPESTGSSLRGQEKDVKLFRTPPLRFSQIQRPDISRTSNSQANTHSDEIYWGNLILGIPKSRAEITEGRIHYPFK